MTATVAFRSGFTPRSSSKGPISKSEGKRGPSRAASPKAREEAMLAWKAGGLAEPGEAVAPPVAPVAGRICMGGGASELGFG